MTSVAPDHIESETGRLIAKRSAAEQRAISGKYVFKAGDVVYSKIRPYLRKAFLADFDGLCSADMYPLSPRGETDPRFVLTTLLGHAFSVFAESASARSGMAIIPAGTLLMSFKPSIGRLAFAGRDLFTNEAICAFRKLKANASFLYYALQRVDFSQYGKQAVKGYTLNQQSLNAVEVSLPGVREQEAIAEILSDMDAEITALEARRDKTRQLKQGMMQALLTGRIRLV